MREAGLMTHRCMGRAYSGGVGRQEDVCSRGKLLRMNTARGLAHTRRGGRILVLPPLAREAMPWIFKFPSVYFLSCSRYCWVRFMRDVKASKRGDAEFQHGAMVEMCGKSV